MSRWILGLCGGILIFGGLGIRRYERSAADDIRRQLGGTPKVDVRMRLAGLSGGLASATITASKFSAEGLPFFTEPERSDRGRLQELRIRLADFTLRGLRVERLEAKIPSCRFDYSEAVHHGRIRLSRSGVGTGAVTVRAEDLEAFAQAKYRDIREMKLRIDAGRIYVSGRARFHVFEANFAVDAAMQPLDGSKLTLTDAKIVIEGIEANPVSREALLKTLNPIIDLNRDLKLFDAIRVERLTLAQGSLRAEGATTIPQRPAAPE